MVVTVGALVVVLVVVGVEVLVVVLVVGVEVLVEVLVEVELEVVGVFVEVEVVGVLVLVLVVVDFVVCFEKQLFGEATPQTTLLSKEHSFVPRKILNKPSFPQSDPHEFTTSQYLCPLSSASPQPITLTACQPWDLAPGVK